MNRSHFYVLCLFHLAMGVPRPAKTPDSASTPQDQTQGPPPAGDRGPHRGGARESHGTPGKITAIHGNSLQLVKPDGSTITVNLTDKTEFRKDRQPAKLADFKVGDFVMASGDENPDHC